MSLSCFAFDNTALLTFRVFLPPLPLSPVACAHLSSPHSPFAGQFAMAIRVPVLVVAYLVIPKEETAFAICMILALIIGLSSMAGVAVNRPILADVVRPNHKATVFALVDPPFESREERLTEALKELQANKSDSLSDEEHSFGYVRTTRLVAEMLEQLRMGDADALANALVFLTVIPWSISFLLYGLLHLVYGCDQVAMNAMVAKEYHPEEQDYDRESEDSERE
ncbi:transmembrane domain-containing protein [Cyclospora cayetanensis]|uniref:Transmembrane domain-containing protein n=1 Tax=Cyclospora cayetanensis TaxID=88456 RepID=A0A1D3CRL2_9EIME|nr:transmembrane domain-containing protein [Cyclospora cayetanensis]